MIATAQAFAKETRGAPSAPDLQKRGVTKGFLSDWWSVFWDSFSSGPGDSESEHPEGYVQEEKPLEMGDDFSLEEEQMLQRAATLECSDVPQQDPVADSAFYQRFLGHAPIEITAPGLMQQQYQQPTDGKGSDDMIDLSRDVSAEKTMGIAIEEVFRLKASHKKIFCCSFSSDGELLGSAGDENKVFLRNLRNNLEGYAWEAHSSFITDMRFQPNKSILATASSDKTVRLWDTSQDDHFIHTFVGHSSLVRSVDFHPKADSSLLCSCDDGGKVLFWKIGNDKAHKSEATGRGKVRFDPTGSCLASVIGNTVNVTNIQKDKRISCLQGNGDNKTVHSICWSEHLRCLASVSDDCVRVWPSQGVVGHVRELSGTKLSYFRSCSFHPKYPNTLVIGGYQTITLWDFAENKVVSVQPHDGYVADLAGCHATGMLASASHDGCVKVWR
ncbi:hypothetical protein QOZ80_3BG0297310 [Eleusine coracana subsp. coracana]|nr:hypothetical protein QOZ80_3BG0297310 [Eleusine coracana subsp. coracana]